MGYGAKPRKNDFFDSLTRPPDGFSSFYLIPKVGHILDNFRIYNLFVLDFQIFFIKIFVSEEGVYCLFSGPQGQTFKA